jgi:methyltransferase-like protein
MEKRSPAEPGSSYDEVPYIAAAFPQSHPDRLATPAKLLGLAPPALDTCRVLELGCASGGNLIPMAVSMPDATFVGVDLSRRQIEQGCRNVEALGLRNIELRHANIADVDADYGRFDYVIAHGVYSWVPEAVREKLLAICHDNLVPNGVAYVSYNTLPGWRMRGMIRDMMFYHASPFEGAKQRVEQARALIDFLAQGVPGNTPYGMTLKQELDAIRTQHDAYLYHEHLEEINAPCYFHEFAAAAKRHRLQYLADVEMSTMLLSGFAPQVVQTLKRLGTDLIRAEQYMDFLRNRTFRQTLLVHDDLTIRRAVDAAVARDFYVASPARTDSLDRSPAKGVIVTYHSAKGRFSTSSPVTKSAMGLLGQRWPLGMPFEELLAAARAKLGAAAGAFASGPDDATVLGTDMLQAYSVEIVELCLRSPRLSIGPSERPLASPLARLQAGQGNVVTNLRHEPAKLDRFAHRMLPLLDGTRDRRMLVDELARDAAEGRLDVPPQGGAERLTGEPALRQALDRALDAALSAVARSALLIA